MIVNVLLILAIVVLVAAIRCFESSAAAAIYKRWWSKPPSCADCGAVMVRSGQTYKCLNCGSTSGCS